MTKIVVFSNDKIHHENKIISSNYNDTINILESINQNFEVLIFSRKSNKKQNFFFQENKQITVNKLFNFFKIKNFKLLIISLTPRNFINFLIFNFFHKNFQAFLLLRSNGQLEYKAKFGFVGAYIYQMMLNIISKYLKIISVSKHITEKKIDFILHPSEITENWLVNHKKPNLKLPKLLYFGRYKEEKGFFFLIDIFKKIKINLQLTIAGDKYKIRKKEKNITILNEILDQKKIIELYDDHNIFILPSYTEGAPKVILESLARLRPVIIFEDIGHLKFDYHGIFVCQRNYISLQNQIEYIIRNYLIIQNEIKKNILPTRKEFQKKIRQILNESLHN